ncbi:hypothetical protein GCM10025780_29670 [Frondihabitans cladoniiphilus]|uniref:Uncharacterized protein n=1 Tax=Frondihabitans cladoniiphilus TaxID=715785 RepID=A0ABP8W8W4_9MICO
MDYDVDVLHGFCSEGAVGEVSVDELFVFRRGLGRLHEIQEAELVTRFEQPGAQLRAQSAGGAGDEKTFHEKRLR